MRLGLLGPVRATVEGQRLDLGGPTPRLILSLLAVDLGQVVPTERLIRAVWADSTTDRRSALQVNISNLRRALRPDGHDPTDGPAIQHEGSGYVLRTAPDLVDIHRFGRLVEEGAGLVPGDPHRGAAVLRDALGLWRGRSFGDLNDRRALAGDVTRLEELRRRAIELRSRADLELGHHERVAQDLPAVAAANPLRESLWELLALAQYRDGRQVDALATLDALRAALAEQLGVDPSPALQDLHARILRQDPTLAAPTGGNHVRTPIATVRRHRLLEVATTSGALTTYRALAPDSGEPVAITRIDPDSAGTAPAEAIAERARRLVGLEAPAVTVIDSWSSPDGVHVVTPWVDATPLAATVDRGAWRPRRAVALVTQLARTLDSLAAVGLAPGHLTCEDVDLGDDDRPSLAAAVLHRVASDEHDASPAASVAAVADVAAAVLTGQPPAGPPEITATDGWHLPPAAARVIQHAREAEGEHFADVTAFASSLDAAVLGRGDDLFSAEIRNPYKGLRAFVQDDHEDFFGRERLVEQLIERIDDEPLITLVGPSGAGKSSAVRAGLLPTLRDARHDQAPLVVVMTPGEWPMAELERTLVAAGVAEPDGALPNADDPEALLAAVDHTLGADHPRLVLVVDQFEEAFVLSREDDRRAFLDTLAAVVRQDHDRIRLVLTLRADLYDDLLLDPALGPLVAAHTVPITPMTGPELEHAITAPARAVGLRVEAALTAALVADVVGAAGSLPLLQYALTELCERRRDDLLRLADYDDHGRLRGTLAGRADELYTALSPTAQRTCRQIFLRLVVVTERVVETRRRVLRPQLEHLGPDGDSDDVLEAFGAHRLLTFDRDPFTGVATVEIAHEALTHAWGRLRGWIDGAREDLVVHRRLLAAGEEWRLAGRDDSYLLRGTRLDDALAWWEATDLRLTQDEAAFLDASRAARDQVEEEERQRAAHEARLERHAARRLRGLVALLAVAVIGTTSLAVFALAQRDRARQQEAAAEQQRATAEGQRRIATARELAAAATNQLDVDPERSLLLAIEAVETTLEANEGVLPEARTALHDAVRSSLVRSVHDAGGGLALGPDGSLAITDMGGTLEVLDPDGAVRWRLGDRPVPPLVTIPDGSIPMTFLARTAGVAIAPDGASLATTSDELAVEVRAMRDGNRTATLDRAAFDPSWSPDGGTIAAILVTPGNDVAWGAGRSLGLFDPATGALVRTLEGHGTSIQDHAFSPDGSLVATVSPHEGTLRLWEVASGDQVAVHQRNLVKAVAFSPDGTRIIVGSGDGTAAVLDAQALDTVTELRDHDGDIFAVGFSPDSEVAAIGGSGAGLWDATTGTRVLDLPGHAGVVSDLAFSADGAQLVTTAEDATTRTWDITTPGGTELRTLPAPAPPARGALAFSPTDDLLATSAPDGLRLHDTAGLDVARTIPTDGAAISTVDFSPDGTRVAAGLFRPGEDRPAELHVWDTASGTVELVVGDHGGMIFDLDVSDDGRFIATGTDDEGFVRIIDTAAPEDVRTFRLTQGSVLDVEFVPAGLFVGGQDAGLVLDPRTAEPRTPFPAVDETIIDAAPTDDGRIVTGDVGGRARLWDPATGALEATARRAAGGAIVSVAVHEELLASGGPGGVVVTDLATMATHTELGTGHDGPVGDLSFSRDGRLLATAGSDGTVRLFLLDTTQLLDLARERTTRTLTDEECERFLHRTCG